MNKKHIDFMDDFLNQINYEYKKTFKTFHNIYSSKNKQEFNYLKILEKRLAGEGWLENEFGNYKNLFQDDIDLINQKKEDERRRQDNLLIPALKIEVDQILSYNHANDFVNHKHSKEYIKFRKEVYPQLEKSGIKNIINKDHKGFLKIKLYIQVKNYRKDSDNLEKTIIDTLSSHLGINDNLFKEKTTKVIELTKKDLKDKFIIVIEHLPVDDLYNDFIFD